ncbi:MAG: MFS transporter [Streptosporangiaceae bacterium]
MGADMLSAARSRVNPYVLYVGIETSLAFTSALISTTSVVYWVKSGHLGALQLILLGTMVELAYFFFQVPTGVVADLVSRRLCVILGVFLTALGFLIQWISADFAVLLLAQIPVGIGAALMVGAQSAWLADESGDTELTSVFLRAAQFALFGALAGSVLSGVLALAGLSLPFLAGGLLTGVVGLALVALMPENHFTPPKRIADLSVIRHGWSALTEQSKTTRIAMAAVPGLVLLLGMIFFRGLWGESFDRLWGAYLLTDIRFPDLLGLRPVTWFSVIAICVTLLSLISMEVAKRRTDKLGPSSVVGTMMALTIATAAFAVAMAAARSFALVVIAYLAVATIRPVFAPLMNGWMIARVDSRVRATALSAVDLFDAGGQIVGGPVVGVVGALASIRLALLAGAVALLPAVGLLVAASRRVRAYQN